MLHTSSNITDTSTNTTNSINNAHVRDTSGPVAKQLMCEVCDCAVMGVAELVARLHASQSALLTSNNSNNNNSSDAQMSHSSVSGSAAAAGVFVIEFRSVKW